ncbi:peptide-methionine (R)-S-oxide reductase, partial [Candidatus Daviesbacteria bacterium]|nr:peptide-methionine (R)-S-oxide reductase [Candidatus Daviesbacteria bacterium]
MKKIDNFKKKLTPEQYNVCFLKGTEPPFSGKYTNNYELGVYSCVVCQTPLFSSGAKFDSKTGWPSFDKPVMNKNIAYADDYSMGVHRIEVMCK